MKSLRTPNGSEYVPTCDECGLPLETYYTVVGMHRWRHVGWERDAFRQQFPDHKRIVQHNGSFIPMGRYWKPTIEPIMIDPIVGTNNPYTKRPATSTM